MELSPEPKTLLIPREEEDTLSKEWRTYSKDKKEKLIEKLDE